MNEWIQIRPGHIRKVYGAKPVRQFGVAPSLVVNSVKGTSLDGIDLYGSKMPHTAVSKLKMETLRTRGKAALEKTFRRYKHA